VEGWVILPQSRDNDQEREDRLLSVVANIVLMCPATSPG